MKPEDLLRKVSDSLGSLSQKKQEEKSQLENERRNLITGIGKDIVDAIAPSLDRVAQQMALTRDEISQAVREIQVASPEIPEIRIPEFNIPEPKVTVNIPETKIPPFPEIRIPENKFPDRFNVGLPDYSNERPLPVMMMDTKGRPLAFPASGGGGKADFLTIKNILNSSGGSVIDESTGAMKITGDIQVTAQAGTTISLINRDGEYYNGDNPMPVTFSAASIQPVSQVSGQAWSVSVNDIYGTVATNLINPDGRMKVELPTGSSGLTDTELRATAVPVSQVSGVLWSVTAFDIFGTTVTSSVVNADNRVKVEIPATTITAVTSITNTIAAMNVDSTGVGYSGSNPLPISDAGGSLTVDGTVTVSSVTATIAAMSIDSTGVGYSGSNPMPVLLVANQNSSTVVVGDTLHDAADTGAAPVKVGGVAMITNPTVVADGDRVNFRADDIGRQLNRPIQVRDLIVTAYVSITSGTETTLLAASAGLYHDMIMIVGSNNSDAAVSVDIRAVSSGNIINTLRIPANGTAGWTPPVPWPQDATGNNWTVDGPDETGRTLTFSALFSREV